MDAELKNLRIDRGGKESKRPLRWVAWSILTGTVLLAAGHFGYGMLDRAIDVEVVRVRAPSAGDSTERGDVLLNATGYIVTAHKIELAAKVVGRIAWIGVEKADRVKQGQQLVRLEDEEYRAQVQQAEGNLANLQARLTQLLNGSRPEEIAKVKADAESARADAGNAQVVLERTKKLVEERVLAPQALDDAQARYDGAVARVASLDLTHSLAKLGPRREEIDAARGQIQQAEGQLAYAQVQLDSTVIRAPVTGTVLERNVEKGEFVTTGAVGDKGAKGYVLSMADLTDLKVELDINQNDFAKLGPHQKGIVTTDAFPDRHYGGAIDEVSPEANRQKATVQLKVKILKPDEYLRPEMNASVAFIAVTGSAAGTAPPKISTVVPSSAVRDGAVFVASNGRAVRRTVKTGATVAQSVHIEEGLIGGEDVLANPPPDLKDGDRVKAKNEITGEHAGKPKE